MVKSYLIYLLCKYLDRAPINTDRTSIKTDRYLKNTDTPPFFTDSFVENGEKPQKCYINRPPFIPFFTVKGILQSVICIQTPQIGKS